MAAKGDPLPGVRIPTHQEVYKSLTQPRIFLLPPDKYTGACAPSHCFIAESGSGASQPLLSLGNMEPK